MYRIIKEDGADDVVETYRPENGGFDACGGEQACYSNDYVVHGISSVLIRGFDGRHVSVFDYLLSLVCVKKGICADEAGKFVKNTQPEIKR